jgi:hypothetical protein
MPGGPQPSLDDLIQDLQEAALRSEVDLSLLRANLAASPTERLRQHDRFLAFLLTARPPAAARHADQRRAAEEAE